MKSSVRATGDRVSANGDARLNTYIMLNQMQQMQCKLQCFALNLLSVKININWLGFVMKIWKSTFIYLV